MAQPCPVSQVRSQPSPRQKLNPKEHGEEWRPDADDQQSRDSAQLVSEAWQAEQQQCGDDRWDATEEWRQGREIHADCDWPTWRKCGDHWSDGKHSHKTAGPHCGDMPDAPYIFEFGRPWSSEWSLGRSIGIGCRHGKLNGSPRRGRMASETVFPPRHRGTNSRSHVMQPPFYCHERRQHANCADASGGAQLVHNTRQAEEEKSSSDGSDSTPKRYQPGEMEPQ